MIKDIFVSIVLTPEKDASLYKSIYRIYNILKRNFSDYEIILVANGRVDWAKQMDETLGRVPCIRYIQLSSTVHVDVARAAGLENAIGDFVVLFDCHGDLENSIPDLINLGLAGNDIVIGASANKATFLYRMVRSIMDRPLKAIGYDLPRNATTLRCLSRRAVNAVTAADGFHYRLYARIQKTGYRCTVYNYARRVEREPGKSLGWGIRGFLHLLVFNSTKPLRWASLLGFAGSAVAFAFASYSVLLHLFTGNITEGWTTTVFFMSLFFMIQFVILIFVGEYIGRLLIDRNEQAEYAVAFEKNSFIMVNEDRLNVLDEPDHVFKNLSQTGRNR